MFDPHSKPDSGWRRDLYTVFFETDTPLGWAFDVALLLAIVLSVLAVSLETVLAPLPGDPFRTMGEAYPTAFLAIEWVLTIVFTIEYVLRLFAVRNQMRYASSFFGIVDLVAILPTYLALVVVDAGSLQIVRALRLLRIFRVLKLGKFMREGEVLARAIQASRYKISVFLFGVLTVVMIQGALIYAIEGGPQTDFSSIPMSVYWAIVTLTTVGYGDISPHTPLGQAVASMVMLMGYGVIAVPTGIVSVEIARASHDTPNLARETEDPVLHSRTCKSCGVEEADVVAHFCRQCGTELPFIGEE